MAKTKPPRPGLPSRDQLIQFIAESPTPVGKREIARAFKVGPADRVALKGLLKSIEREEGVSRTRSRRLMPAAALPEIGVLEVIGLEPDGELLARPVDWVSADPPPTVVVVPEIEGAVTIGDRVVAKLRRLEDGGYRARVIRSLGQKPGHLVGIYRALPEGGRIEPTDRRQKSDFAAVEADDKGVRDGDLVVVEPLPPSRFGLPKARVIERIGDSADPRSISLIAIHTNGIPTEFTPEAVVEAERAQPVGLDGRTDLRPYPLVTIDGADARDFDDAVWASGDDDPLNPGGWHLLVAIADVAWYVRPGSPLDRDAAERGNSVYFPDRVVPMLPEALSNELCSLKPAVERACMAVHMWIDRDGGLLRHQFVRGLMKSVARLTYEQAQAARDGRPDETTAPMTDTVIAPLYGAFAALSKGRAARNALELDLPERKVTLGADGFIASIEPRQRLDSHKLIEEFMITANVAAAETLEAMKQPCMYRIHDAPDPAKVAALGAFLKGLEDLGLHWAKGQVVRGRQFNQLLVRAAQTPYARAINDLVLRTQSQAVYSPANIGHFGLALRRYAHFTSPIRRYSDLLVHRALISGGGFGEGGLGAIEPERFATLGEHISMTERRAATAERSALERYTVAFLSSRVGATFPGRVGGVAKFGLFVTLDETGADGLVPMSHLPADYYVHDEAGHRLVGRRWGRVYTIGDTVTVKLAEANTTTGSLLMQLVESGEGSADTEPLRAPPRTGRKQLTKMGVRKGGKPSKTARRGR